MGLSKRGVPLCLISLNYNLTPFGGIKTTAHTRSLDVIWHKYGKRTTKESHVFKLEKKALLMACTANGTQVCTELQFDWSRTRVETATS